jgi:hypothetical protein
VEIPVLKLRSRILFFRARGWSIAIFLSAIAVFAVACNGGGSGSGY